MSILESFITESVPGLTAGVRTALPYIKGLTLQGTVLSGPTIRALAGGGIPVNQPILSANEIIRRVRSSGFTVNRQQALKVIKALKEQISAHQYIQSLPGSYKPVRSRIPLAGQHQRFPYHVTVAVNFRDRFTGEIHTQFITVSDTRLISKARAQVLAADTAIGSDNYQITEITGTTVVTYTRVNPAIN